MSTKLSATVTGLGIVSAVGTGKVDFLQALLEGKTHFSLMQRQGRVFSTEEKTLAFLGAEIPEMQLPERFSKRMLRSCSISAKAALLALSEAWDEAQLDDVDPTRIGLIIGGSNSQQRELFNLQQKYAARPNFVPPNYAMQFLDTDISGVCTEAFRIKGPSYSLGGASASGQLAVIQAVEMVESGRVDQCIAIGALQDLLYLGCQALSSVGGMGSERYYDCPEQAARPFDKARDGFIFGESSAAIVIESEKSREKRQSHAYATVTGCAHISAANRNPNASVEAEIEVIEQAMLSAQLRGEDIGYISPHGPGSLSGDEIELQALKRLGLEGARINTTKSITGHGLSSAGATEIVATLLQLQSKQLHPSNNLFEPIDPDFNWVISPTQETISNALCLSYGFGGINTALCLANHL